MANQRDVKMTLSVETLGTEEIQALQSRVLALAKQAGDAAPEFEQLADEIGKLGAQADALRNIAALGEQVDQLALKERAAAEESTRLRANLDTLAASTKEAAARQAAAATAYEEAKAKLADLRGQIEILGKSYDANGDRVAGFRDEIKRLTVEKVAQRAALEEARAALVAENAELTKAEAAQGKLEKAYERSNKALTTSTRALDEQRAVLAQSAAAVEALGLSSTNLAGSQAQVIAALNATGQAAQRTRADLDALAQSQADAAEEARLLALQEAAQLALRKRAADERIALEMDISAAVKREQKIRSEAEKQAAAEAAEAASQLAARSKAAAQALDDAFGTLGVRSVKELEAEILQVRAAMDKVQTESGQTGAALSTAFAAGKGRINELERELRAVRNELTLTDKAAGLFKNSLGQIAAGNIIADAVGALVERVKELGRQFILVNVQAETMTRGLTAIYKSSTIAAEQMSFLRGTASAAGLSISDISDSFVRFNAATKSSNIPLEQSNALFRAVAQASATLGLSSQRATLAIDALGQIASKGVVSMEELRQQLGDSVPGALSLTAKGLGIADAELIKLVESGKLASRDFFPAFTKGLQTLTGETDGIQASWNRFKTSLTLVAQAIGDAGFIQVLTVAIKGLGAALSGVALVVGTFAEAVFLAAKGVAAAALVIKGEGAEAAKIMGEEVEKSAARINTMRDSIEALIDPAGEAAKRLADAGTAAAGAGVQAQVNASEVAKLSAKYVEATTDALQYEGAQQALAIAQKITADSSADLGAQYTQLGVQLATLTTAQENEVVVRSKATKTTQEQATSIVELAKIRGDEQATVEAQIAANDLLRTSLNAEAQARETYVATLAVELESKRQIAIAQGTLEERSKTELNTLEQKIEKAKADAEASRAQAEALGVVGLALEKNRLAYQDNATQVAAFRASYDAAAKTVETVRLAMAAGTATAADMTAAQTAVAVAASRLNDALRDQVSKIDAVTRSKIAANGLDTAGLQLALAQAKSDEERARRLGNENSLRIALIRQKEIEIQLDKLKAEATVIEAKGSIASAEAKRAAALASGTLTDVMKIELDTQIRLAEVKLKESEIIGVVVKSREEELARIKARRQEIDGETAQTEKNSDANRDNASSRDELSSSIDRESAARGRNAEAMRRESEASSKMTSTVRGADGRTDAQRERLAGQGGPVDASLPFTLQERAARGDKFTAQDMPLIQAALASAEQNLAISQSNPMAVSLAGMADMESRVLSLRQILDRATADVQTAQRGNQAQAPKPPGAPAPAPAAPAGQVVNINLGGRVSQVRVSDAASAANLESVLRQLASAAGTST
jgi:tape measure domain-containing protein